MSHFTDEKYSLKKPNKPLRVHNFSIKCQNLEPGTQVYTPVMTATLEAEAGGQKVLEQYRQLSEMRVKGKTTRPPPQASSYQYQAICNDCKKCKHALQPKRYTDSITSSQTTPFPYSQYF